ncbi:hypothetical protein QQP08_019830 [Theobroma cacao]|nr:hypothetical protein QQP08_019830 [Theobroma cacao]
MINGGIYSQRIAGRPIPKRGQVKVAIVLGLAHSVASIFCRSSCRCATAPFSRVGPDSMDKGEGRKMELSECECNSLCGSERKKKRKKNGRCKKGNDQQWEFFTKDCWTSDPKEGSSESGNIGGDCPFFCFYIFSKQSQGSCCCKLVLALHLCPKQGKKERHEILMILEERVGGVVACPRKDVSCLVFG